MAAGLSELKQVYLIYGAEDLLLEQALSRLKRMVGEVADLDFNMDAFDGESVNADDVVAACNTLPFVSERRLVIVKNVDKMARDGQEVLAQYAADPAPTTVLVLVAVKLAKNSRLFKTIDKMGGASEYAAPRKSDYPREVQRLVSDRGRTVTREGAETLVQAVGFDLRRRSTSWLRTRASAPRSHTKTSSMSFRRPPRHPCSSSPKRLRIGMHGPVSGCWATSSTRASRSSACTRLRCARCATSSPLAP